LGRKRYGTYSQSWQAPDYTVDDDGRLVGGYRPSGSNNWGRWGPDDERGTANLITETEVRHAASLVRHGKVFSLALPIDNTAPRWPERPPVNHYFLSTGSDVICGAPYNRTTENFVFADDCFEMATQASTQWDALSHVTWQDAFYNGFWAGSLTAARGAERLGIGAMHSSFIGRGVLLDLARHAGVDSLEPGRVVELSDLEAVREAQGVEVRPGDIVLLRTGYMQRWWALSTHEQKAEYFAAVPGVGCSTVDWFVEHDVAAVASDTVSFEVIPSEDPSRFMQVHCRLLVDLGLTIGEFWVLDELAADCAQDGVYEFLLVAPPLYLPRAVGAPLNPIAIK
jgi:kynurenine formamidase